MGNQFIDRATAMEIVASNCPPAEGDHPLSEDDELIYIPTEQLKCDTQMEDDKKKIQSKLIPFKKEKTPSQLSSSSSLENKAETVEANDIPVFKHTRLKRQGGKHMCIKCKITSPTKSELKNHFASHTNITFKCNVCSSVYRSEQSYKNHCVTF